MPVVSLTRRYRFPAAHRLHSPALSDERNREVYGKCNNPHGHGHDYTLELTVRGVLDESTGRLMSVDLLDEFVEQALLKSFRYRNLNVEVEEFAALVPTTENLAAVAAARVGEAWELAFPGHPARPEKVKIWETRNNIFEERVMVGRPVAEPARAQHTE